MPVPPSPERPDFFTVEEAARILRIGRTAAYELARTWRDTDGGEGLPVVAFGRLLRVPRRALEAMTGGPITTTPAIEKKKPVATPTEPEPLPTRVRSEFARPSRRRHSRARSASPDQTTFPFT